MSDTTRVLVVEGVMHDRAFYDRVLRALGVENVSIRLAQDIRRSDGTSSGGKEGSLRLVRELEERVSDGLEDRVDVVGSGLSERLLFLVDRDFDHLSRSGNESPLVVYTNSLDVEAEILLGGDFVDAASSASGLPRADITSLLVSVSSVAKKAAASRRAIIAMRVFCGRHNVHCGEMKGLMKLEDVSDVDLVALRARVLGKALAIGVEDATSKLDECARDVSRVFDKGAPERLVSGKVLQAVLVATLRKTLGMTLPAASIGYALIACSQASAAQHDSVLSHYRREFSRPDRRWVGLTA